MLATDELRAEADQIDVLLDQVTTIAIVGISKNKTKDSFYVGRYLKNAGYKVIPVNPTADTILGQKSYPDLASIPEKVDIVDIFRAPEAIPSAVDEALAIHPKAIWLQLGTGIHPESKAKAEAEGVEFHQNRCLKVDHQFLKRPEQK